MVLDDLVVSIKENEGFRGEVYQDHLENDTLGYGTLMPISPIEATVLLRMRLDGMIKELSTKEPVFNMVPPEAQSILAEMAYQMGVNGLLKFKKTWKYLQAHDFEAAAKEMLDSKWHEQTPNRAKELSERMSKVV